MVRCAGPGIAFFKIVRVRALSVLLPQSNITVLKRASERVNPDMTNLVPNN